MACRSVPVRLLVSDEIGAFDARSVEDVAGRAATAMQRDDFPLNIGQVAGLPALGDGGELGVSFEYRRREGAALELLVWLGPGMARPFLHAGEFWAEWTFGEPCFVRFKHDCTVFNWAAFAAVEVRPARGPEPPPPDALWLLSKPLCLPWRATP